MEKALSASDGPVRATGVVEWLVESGLGGCEVPHIVAGLGRRLNAAGIARQFRARSCDWHGVPLKLCVLTSPVEVAGCLPRCVQRCVRRFIAIHGTLDRIPVIVPID